MKEFIGKLEFIFKQWVVGMCVGLGTDICSWDLFETHQRDEAGLE